MKALKYLKGIFPNGAAFGLFSIMIWSVAALFANSLFMPELFDLTQTMVAGLLAIVCVKYWREEVEKNL